jgi:hypothetical protein
MTIKTLACATTLTLAALTGTALAKKAPPPQDHHCKLKDGTMDMKKTKKQCATAKGTWAKDEAPAMDSPSPSATPKTK